MLLNLRPAWDILCMAECPSVPNCRLHPRLCWQPSPSLPSPSGREKLGATSLDRDELGVPDVQDQVQKALGTCCTLFLC